jgi:hypothetical protein
MIPYAELETFFSDLVARAQRQGIACGITSGMACVHFGVAATTKDCDMLCTPSQADAFRALVTSTPLRGFLPNYRGNISPPLDSRWLQGGWTSHFTWKTKPEETCLDIFGIAPRASTHWEAELSDLYASRHTVAEMKRTNREKDWPYITALGLKLLNAGDSRGLLHIYDAETLLAHIRSYAVTSAIADARPSLTLATKRDTRLADVLHAETVFWHLLDACRIKIYERALRPYVNAVRKASKGKIFTLADSHEIRLQCAEQHLNPTPISNYGFAQLVADAVEATGRRVHPSLMEWLPNGLNHFIDLA